MAFSIQIILVPQGAEYQAVCRGLGQVANPPTVLPIPVGPAATRKRLQELHQSGYFAHRPNVLIMGLCGSLNPSLSVGDIVLYQDCLDYPLPPIAPKPHATDRSLTNSLQAKLGNPAQVKALTSDRVICLAAEKRSLTQYADVVDMEGYPALEFFGQIGVPVATLRVVSDNCQHDLPDLSATLGADGSLQIFPLAMGMLRQPIAAIRLIRGSLRGLSILQAIPKRLFSH